jgi:hypothetical protein
MTVPACACGATLPPDAKFCPACGRTIGAHACACGATVAPEARFCHRCGRAAGAGGVAAAPAPAAAPPLVREQSKAPWLVAGVAIVALLGVMLWRIYDGSPAAGGPPAMANAGNAGPGGAGAAPGGLPPFAGPGVPQGRAPDISNLTPKQRYQRLFNRVMAAGEQGDGATVTNFTPMALGAYEQLPERDQGDRFDAGLLHVQVGNFSAARALADTIRLNGKTNLLADGLLAIIARTNNDAAGELAALRTFRTNWPAEQAQKRAEYELRAGLLALIKARADSIVR